MSVVGGHQDSPVSTFKFSYMEFYLFKTISPILVVGLKNSLSSAQIGGLLLLPLRLPRP